MSKGDEAMRDSASDSQDVSETAPDLDAAEIEDLGAAEIEDLGAAEVEESTDFVDPELAAAQMARRSKAQAVRGGVLGAAMLAVGEIIEPTKTDVSVEQTADVDSDMDDPLAGLDFGELPPLS